MLVEFILIEVEAFGINFLRSKCNITFARGGKFHMYNLVEFYPYEFVGKTNDLSISGIHIDIGVQVRINEFNQQEFIQSSTD